MILKPCKEATRKKPENSNLRRKIKIEIKRAVSENQRIKNQTIKKNQESKNPANRTDKQSPKQSTIKASGRKLQPIVDNHQSHC